MNLLGDLISSSARVRGVTPDELGKGRAALDVAIAAGVRRESPAGRKAAVRWFGFGGLRGKAIIGVAVVAAVAGAVTVLVVPSSPPSSPLASSRTSFPLASSPASSPRADSPAKPKPAGQKTGAGVTYSFSATKDVTAAYVFAQAAKGAQAAQQGPDANVPLVNGWPNALYWQTLTQTTSPDCPGQIATSEVWLTKSGGEVVRNETKGSVPASDSQQCNGPTANLTYPVGGVPAGPMVGGQIYTWAQFAALPTDPAALWPILQADSTTGVASEKGEPEQDFLFQTITLLLESDPVSTAMRVALLEDAEKIPGVTVTGQYTDSLGRTGIALTQGSGSTIIDTSNGQVLASITAEPAHPGCTTVKSGGTIETTCAIGSATVFISEGPASTEPYVAQPAPSLSPAQ